jgi:pectate lyase
MRTIKISFLALLLTGFMGLNAQTYNFSAPQGYGAGTNGGAAGSKQVKVVTNQADLKKYLTGTEYSIIIVQGTIQCSYMSIEVKDKTLLGLPGARLVNNDQTAAGSGILNLKSGSSNVIIRNLIFEGPGAYDVNGRDLLCFEGNKLWVDHCEFQDGVDENFSFKKADNVTVSWCKFTYLKSPKSGGPGGTDDHRFSNLVNGDDKHFPTDGRSNITWQYCWWAKGCVERMVRARNATLHQVNCYWNSPNNKTAIGLGAGDKGCSNYVESGVFDIPGTVSKTSYGGSPSIKFVNCTGGGSNVGTVSKPSYSYEVTPVGSVVSAVTNSSCGAGATLIINTAGQISTSCDDGGTPITGVPIGKTIWIKANSNGKYVCADKGLANTPLIANRTGVDHWEKFDVIDAGGGYIALKANSNGKYVCADKYLGSNAPLAANRTTIGSWEKFQWVDAGSGYFALKANANGKYVCADVNVASNAPLIANRSQVLGWEKFSYGFTTKSAENVMEFTNMSTQGNFKFYPNPMDGQHLALSFELHLPQAVDVFISDQLGKIVYQQTLAATEGINQVEINFGKQLTGGLYFIGLKKEGDLHWEKLIVR